MLDPVVGHVVEYAHTPSFGSQEEHNRRERLTTLTLVNHDGRTVTITTSPNGPNGPNGQRTTRVESCTDGLIATFEHLDGPHAHVSAHEAAALLAVNVMSRPTTRSLGTSPTSPTLLEIR